MALLTHNSTTLKVAGETVGNALSIFGSVTTVITANATLVIGLRPITIDATISYNIYPDSGMAFGMGGLSFTAQAQDATAGMTLAVANEFTFAGQAQDAKTAVSLNITVLDFVLSGQAQLASADFSFTRITSVVLSGQAQPASANLSLYRYNDICWEEKKASGVVVGEHRQETVPVWKEC